MPESQFLLNLRFLNQQLSDYPDRLPQGIKPNQAVVALLQALFQSMVYGWPTHKLNGQRLMAFLESKQKKPLIETILPVKNMTARQWVIEFKMASDQFSQLFKLFKDDGKTLTLRLKDPRPLTWELIRENSDAYDNLFTQAPKKAEIPLHQEQRRLREGMIEYLEELSEVC